MLKLWENMINQGASRLVEAKGIVKAVEITADIICEVGDDFAKNWFKTRLEVIKLGAEVDTALGNKTNVNYNIADAIGSTFNHLINTAEGGDILRVAKIFDKHLGDII